MNLFYSPDRFPLLSIFIVCITLGCVSQNPRQGSFDGNDRLADVKATESDDLIAINDTDTSPRTELVRYTTAAESTRPTIVKVNVDQHRSLAKKLEVSSLPTLMMVKDGNVTHRKIGLTNEKELKSWFR